MDARTSADTGAGRPRSRREGESSSVLSLPRAGRHNLPASASTFIGRGEEMAAIAEQIATTRLLTLAGPGGVGKTRLAVEVGRHLIPAYADGVWLVELADLAPGADPAHAIRKVLRHLVPRAEPGALGRALADRNLLLVLDNCEHVRASCAAAARSVLRDCPRMSVLATSREPLGIAGEEVVRVEPLRGADPGASVDAPASEAARLFTARAKAVRPGFELTPGVRPVVEELCRRVDRLPLAIEMAAARAAVLSPAELVARMGDDFRLLAFREEVRPRRHRSLRDLVGWSHALLTGEEAALLARLAVFPGGCDLAAVEAVCTGGLVAAGAVLDVLGSLVAKSLLRIENAPGAPRYRLPETILAFARAELRSSGQADRWAEAQARWCLGRAEEASRHRGEGRAEWLELLDLDRANCRAALDWARRHGRADLALRLSVALGWYWEARGLLTDGIELLRWGLAAAPDAALELRASALRLLGTLTWLDGDVVAATPLVDAAADLFRAAGRDAEAEACARLGEFHLCANPTHTLPGLDAELARARRRGDRRRLARSLINCGNAHFFAGDPKRSSECFQACLELPRALVDAEVVVDAQIGRGRVAVMAGDLATGESAFARALELAGVTGDDDGRSTALAWLGEVCRIRSDTARARDLLEEAMTLAVRGGLPLSQARCQQFRARVEAADGDLTAARALYSASLAPTGASAMPYHRVRSLQGLADVARALSDWDEARRLAEEALVLGEAHGDRAARAASLTTLARVAHAGGDARRALALADEAFDLQAGGGDAIGMWDSVSVLAELAASTGRAKDAARLIGSVRQARVAAGCASPLTARAARLRDLPRVAELLERGAWARAVDEGATLSPAAAVASARRGRRTRVRPAAGWASLTPVQRRVADLAAADLTNPEIGRHLLVSERTVATHLRHVYRKLGVIDRRELRRAARELAAGEPGTAATAPSRAAVAGR